MINRVNNFDFLRLLFASLVVFSHSFPLTKNPQILSEVTNNQINLGGLSVNVFFIMSGFLIMNSLKRSKSSINYLWKRILRLFPGLIVLTIITLIVLPLYYIGSNIFLEKTYWTYLPNVLSLYRVQYTVSGIFKDNPYPNAINGSLWSLSYEFTMYLFLLLLFTIKKKTKILLFVLVIAFVCSYIFYVKYPDLFKNYFGFFWLDSEKLYMLSTYFLGGSLLTMFNLERINNRIVKVTLTILIVLSIYFNYYALAAPIFLTVLIILIANSYNKILNFIPKKIGDISYGVYIYGFLIQQSLMNYFKLNAITLFLISISITYIISYFSWHYIEKKALRYKDYI